MSDGLLTHEQAYSAMYEYFLALYERTQSDEIGALLGDMSLLPDGGTADPAAWHDWEKCIEKIMCEKSNQGLHLT